MKAYACIKFVALRTFNTLQPQVLVKKLRDMSINFTLIRFIFFHFV